MTRSSLARALSAPARYIGASGLPFLLAAALAAGARAAFLVVSDFFPPLYALADNPRLLDAGFFSGVAGAAALTQYYLASLLSRSAPGRGRAYLLVAAAAVFDGLLLQVFAAPGALGAYSLRWLAAALPAFIGGAAALEQAPEENPWPLSAPVFPY